MPDPIIYSKTDFKQKYISFNWTQTSLARITSERRGAGVKVALLDTGIDLAHEDLVHAIRGGINFTSEYRSDYQDRIGHGTFCAGIIAGSDNGIGITGISPNIELYSVKVINDEGVGSPDWMTCGVEWCIDHGMDIVNLSLENAKPYLPMDLAIRRGVEKGLIFVASAGNLGESDAPLAVRFYPASNPNVLSVAACDEMLQQAAFSVENEEVDVSAPGVNVASCFLGNRYAVMSGTSMAAPFVTGILALVRSQNPTLRFADIEKLLEKMCVDKGLPGKDPCYGWGVFDPVQINELLDDM